MKRREVGVEVHLSYRPRGLLMICVMMLTGVFDVVFLKMVTLNIRLRSVEPVVCFVGCIF